MRVIINNHSELDPIYLCSHIFTLSVNQPYDTAVFKTGARMFSFFSGRWFVDDGLGIKTICGMESYITYPMSDG